MQKFILALTLLASANTLAAQIPYKVTVPVPGAADGTIAYMVNYDTNETVDSTTVAAQKAYFVGDVDEPYMVRIYADGKRMGTLILEQGASAINQEKGFGVGTMLNDQLVDIIVQLNELEQKIEASTSKEEAMGYYNQYLDLELKAINDNLDSPIGYFLFLDYAQGVTPDVVVSYINEHPQLRDYQRIKKLEEAQARTLSTSEGQLYKDFEITYGGVTKKLSDYVGKGKYVLVDFWASWCGPCRKEIKTLKELYNEYGDKGLEILGVAVWDKPEDTIAAIKSLEIPWECIIDAQTIPTDIYGISGIPCIILFGPDGKILSRGLQGAALKAEVAKYF